MIEVGLLTAWIHTNLMQYQLKCWFRPLKYIQNKHRPCCQHTLNNCQAASSAEHHVIASGSLRNRFDICIWEKLVSNHGCKDYALFSHQENPSLT
jgi:hypothetical protein